MKQLVQRFASHIRAGETLVGAMIGVGIFGIPFAFMQAGFLVGMGYLVAIAGVTVLLQLMYSEVILETPGHHRFVGYVKRYLGEKWSWLVTLIVLGTSWGALLAYVLIGGEFAHIVFNPLLGGSVFMYQLGFLVVGFLVSLGGISALAKTESSLVAVLVLVMLIMIIRGLFSVDFEVFTHINWTHLTLPYGVVLFAFGGVTAIPEMRDELKEDGRAMRRVIPRANLVVFILFSLFIFVVLGVSGAATTPDAITGFGAVLGPAFLILGALMGLLAVATSFLVIAVEMQDMFTYDYRCSRILSWFLALIVPLLIFLSGSQSFIPVIRFTGAVFGGLTGMFVVLVYLRVRKLRCNKKATCFSLRPAWGYLIACIFLLGALLEILRPIIPSI